MNRNDSFVVIIFGATGDLMHRKLMPAFYSLAATDDGIYKKIPEKVIVSFLLF